MKTPTQEPTHIELPNEKVVIDLGKIQSMVIELGKIELLMKDIKIIISGGKK